MYSTNYVRNYQPSLFALIKKNFLVGFFSSKRKISNRKLLVKQMDINVNRVKLVVLMKSSLLTVYSFFFIIHIFF